MPPRLTGLAAFQEKMRGDYDSTRVPPSESDLVYVPTGSLTLDWALRRGGTPLGRIIELWGPPDTAKSTIVHCMLASHQQMFPKKAVAYIDMEGTFDGDWAMTNGLDISAERLQHMYPNHSEEASDMARACCNSGYFSAVALDSIGGMESKKALDREAEKDLVGKNAQVITRMVKHLAALARVNGCTVILVNQPRAPVGTMAFSDFPAGPKALAHASTIRIRTRRGPEQPLKLANIDADEAAEVSRQVVMQVDRSKLFPPGRSASFWINMFGTEDYGPAGINVADEYAVMGIKYGIIAPTKDGGHLYRVPALDKPVNGQGAVRKALLASPEAREAVREKLLAGAR